MCLEYIEQQHHQPFLYCKVEKLKTTNWQCLLPHQASLGLPGKITFNGIIIPDSKDITLLFLSVWLAFIAALYAELENDIAMVSVLVVELVDASRYNQLGLLFTPLNQPGVRLLLSLHCYQCYLCGLAWPGYHYTQTTTGLQMVRDIKNNTL